MQIDFHYYATYCAAVLTGYTHEESLKICSSAMFVDCCSATLLKKLHAPAAAATTQLQLEMMDMKTDLLGLQEITRIWASFHFLPGDLTADPGHGGRQYRNKYRLICDTESALLEETVRLAKKEGTLEAAGVAMHVLADTWAHRYFAGTPSLVINNTNGDFTELVPEGSGWTEKPIIFRHNPGAPDDPEKGTYVSSVYQSNENSIMNLGHGRAGHLPDYGFLRYRYLPSWGGYSAVIKDNPSDYYSAFSQMLAALEFLRGDREVFERHDFSEQKAENFREEISGILSVRRLLASEGWKTLGEKLSGQKIPDFTTEGFQQEYLNSPADRRDSTFLGRFITAALNQKSMVTNRIFLSGSLLAGISVSPELSRKAVQAYLKAIGKEIQKGGMPK